MEYCVNNQYLPVIKTITIQKSQHAVNFSDLSAYLFPFQNKLYGVDG
jgi:hypothetical protein